VGAGSGTDALLSATLVGSEGKVWGIDMTAAMLQKARANAMKMPNVRIEFLEGNAEEIPLPDAAVDVVTSNGVLNLVPDKAKAFAYLPSAPARWTDPNFRHRLSQADLAALSRESSIVGRMYCRRHS
jgi:SAM-dependent methyltransferase